MIVTIISRATEGKCPSCNNETDRLYAFKGQENNIRTLGMCSRCLVDWFIESKVKISIDTSKVADGAIEYVPELLEVKGITITVENVDVDQLHVQKKELVKMIWDKPKSILWGIVHLIDHVDDKYLTK